MCTFSHFWSNIDSIMIKKAQKLQREFKVLDEVSHILLRPNMYIGQTTRVKKDVWIFNSEQGKFEFKEVAYIPALLKVFDEIIDNCLDVAIETNFTKLTTISVKIDGQSFSCVDNGPGISTAVLETDSKKRTCSELAWTQVRAGTSFQENRVGPSANGIGSTASNIFSKKFIGIADDGKFRQKIVCKDNMSKIDAQKPVASSGRSGVSVYMEPDLARFKLTEITQEHIDLIYQRLLNLSILFPALTFKFNGKTIRCNKRQFAQYFSKDAVVTSSDNCLIVVFPNEYDEFVFFSYVNGLNVARGGTHIQYLSNEISSKIRDKLVRQFKSIRPGDVKNKLGMVVFMTGVKNLQFDAQTKESISNAPSEMKSFFEGEKIDIDKFVRTILRNEAIIDPIIETFKIKEEAKNRLILKANAKKRPKIAGDKYLSPTGKDFKYFIIAEGVSAMGGISQALGRNGIGYYASRGVPLNVYDARLSKIAANAEFKDITSIMGIDPTKKNEDIIPEMVVLGNDADLDGSRIASLYMGWWIKLCPAMFNAGRIARLKTPLVILWENTSMTKIYKAFYNLGEFKEFESKNDISKYKKSYMKGLGSWSKEQFQTLFDSSPNGIADFLEVIELDDKGVEMLDDWLNGEKADKRKEYLRAYTLDIESV